MPKIGCVHSTTLSLSPPVNLTTAGQDDSSSEEALSIPPTSSSGGGAPHVAVNGKPAVPPRPRSISVDHSKRNGLSQSGAGVGSPMRGKAAHVADNSTGSGGPVAVDVDSADCK